MNIFKYFFEGIGSVFNIWPDYIQTKYDIDSILNRTNEENFRQDWEELKSDFESVIGK